MCTAEQLLLLHMDSCSLVVRVAATPGRRNVWMQQTFASILVDWRAACHEHLLAFVVKF
jgi:hypothetical protein